MKILIAYDGSRCSEAAIDDLQRAGLPEKGEAVVVSVAEVWLPPQEGPVSQEETIDPYIAKLVERSREKGEKALAEAEAFALHAENRIKKVLDGWSISKRATYGSPAWEVLSIADEMQPDLIVAGSHGQSALSRFFLGSISQKLITEAKCSVRVARGKIETDPSNVRVVIGFDSSKGAHAAVAAVAGRNWPEGTEVRLVAVTDSVSPTAIGRFLPPVSDAVNEVNETEREWIEGAAKDAIASLEKTGLKVSMKIVPGNPKEALNEEAESWNADSIFMGANAFGSRLERYLIGSTSAAVAARAHCSVEVVRTQD